MALISLCRSLGCRYGLWTPPRSCRRMDPAALPPGTLIAAAGQGQGGKRAAPVPLLLRSAAARVVGEVQQARQDPKRIHLFAASDGRKVSERRLGHAGACGPRTGAWGCAETAHFFTRRLVLRHPACGPLDSQPWGSAVFPGQWGKHPSGGRLHAPERPPSFLAHSKSVVPRISPPPPGVGVQLKQLPQVQGRGPVGGRQGGCWGLRDLFRSVSPPCGRRRECRSLRHLFFQSKCHRALG